MLMGEGAFLHVDNKEDALVLIHSWGHKITRGVHGGGIYMFLTMVYNIY
jgi:hypothetical protein